MKTLGINTALPLTEVTLIEEDKTIVSESWSSNYDEAEKTLPVIKKILSKHGTPDQILVVTGPGAFTGLRVGVTIANTLAYVHRVPIISISTFEYLQHKIPQKLAQETAIIMRAGSSVAMWLPQDKKIHKIKKDEVEPFLGRHKKIQYVVSDVRDDARENYSLPKGIKWLELSKLQTMPEAVKTVLEEDHPHHKVVQPQYLAPPHITKSKKPLFHLKGGLE